MLQERNSATSLSGKTNERFHTNVEDVVSAEYQVAKVCNLGTIMEFSGPLENDIHVNVTIDHLSSVFSVVFQSDQDFIVYSLNKQVQRFS